MKRLLLATFLPFSPLTAEQPNIIYILADDLGYGDLSCYGQTKLTTPNIDRLAKEGMKFTNHYSGNTVCSPSRAVLMTGVESGKCYVRGNMGNESLAALPEEMMVLPEVFQAAGYRTGGFGKWGLGQTNGSKPERPTTHGFDEFVGWKNQKIAHTYYPTSYIHNGQEIPLETGTYLSPLLMQAARDFISHSVENEQPFFCYIPTAIPHAAMHAPPELHMKWRLRFPEHDRKIGKYGSTYRKGDEFQPTPDVLNPIAGFAAMMEHLDNEVGAILALLQELGIDNNTLVLFASDNGPHQEGGHDPAFWNSSGGLRGHKRDMHEGGIRSPLLARWPGQIPPGTESKHLSGFHDMLPTFAELIGQKVPSQNTGISMVPTLLRTGKQPQHDYLFIEFTKGAHKLHSRALRFENWKAYHRIGQEIELFDLKIDPFEQDNLAPLPEFEEVMKKVAQLMEAASQPLP